MGRFVAYSGRRNDADRTPAFFAFKGELNVAFDQREQGVILADADVFTGVKGGTALANNDVAGDNPLPTVALYAKAFRFRVATVADTAACFFVCHESVSFRSGRGAAGYGVDPDLGVVLTMTLMLLVMLATTHFEDRDLVVTAL